MKKKLVMLLVLILVPPAMAVTFTASNPEFGVLKIDYNLASREVLRGLALKLTRTSGDATVHASGDVVVTPFNTFIDYAFSNPTGYDVGVGHPIANPAAAGVATLPASTFSISVGFLDPAGYQNGVAANGTIIVKLTGTRDSCFDIELDTLRGGVVGDIVIAPAAGWKISQCIPFIDCCFVSSARCDEWVSVGMPSCWCSIDNPRQCLGDADGWSQGKQNYWVSTNDLSILLAAWNKPFEQIAGQKLGSVYLICADFDHAAQGKQRYRVSTNDLNILLANWNQPNGPAPRCSSE